MPAVSIRSNAACTLTLADIISALFLGILVSPELDASREMDRKHYPRRCPRRVSLCTVKNA